MGSTNFESSIRWYAIHTHPKQEARAESNLLAWNVETFVPRYRSRRSNQFRSEPIFQIKPLFARYIFARFDADDISHKVRYTRGVHSIVSVGGWPAPLDDPLIDMMKARQDEDGLIRLYDNIKSGDEVVVDAGNFSGFVGVFERRINDSGRVMILLKAATYSFHVVVPENNVSKVSI
jgi:transcription elongation factor/antiterminator RfaH